MRAYSRLPDEPENAATRAMILYAIASARLEAYKVDEDVENLNHAQRLLEKFKAGLDPEDAEGHAAVDEYLARVAELRAECEQRDAEAAASTPAPAPEPAPEPEPAPAQPVDAPPPTEAGRGLIIAGATLSAIGAGLGLGGGVAFGLAVQAKNEELEAIQRGNPDDVTREEAIAVHDDARAAELAEFVTIGVGAGVTAVGVGLLVTGLVKRARGSAASVAVAPTLQPGLAGFTLHGRF